LTAVEIVIYLAIVTDKNDAKKTTRKKVPKAQGANPSYLEAKVRYDGLTPDERNSIKAMLLDQLAQGFDRREAAAMVGMTVRELRSLIASDPEFKAQIAAIKKGDDDTLADRARANLMKLMECEDPKARNVVATVSIYVDKTRGGYMETRKTVSERRSVDPTELRDHAKPKAIPDKIALKPPREPVNVPPPEVLDDDAPEADWMN